MSDLLGLAAGCCDECGGNGYAGGNNTGSGEYDDICLTCMGDGLGVEAKAVDLRLAELFPEWEVDQRNAIASELATCALCAAALRARSALSDEGKGA